MWRPGKIGELFILVWPNGDRMLMRVSSLDDNRWNARQASVDEAIMVTGELPLYNYRSTTTTS